MHSPLNPSARFNYDYFAKLGGGERGEDPWITVSTVEGGTGRKYSLMFASDKEKCGVLKFNLEGKDYFKMFVWDQTVDTALDDCEQNFYVLSTESYTVYSSDCKAKSVQNN
ncbi:uncharacterized protein LOC142578069 isoform X2 [Dermacentor variabilis]|uniref:uncharacterized protein LOC142578069 isoform X2 n=1 Tax=Dermacentor variabilis TaxID=34621 RepID=UPI003F5C2688